MHLEQIEFLARVREFMPAHFSGAERVLEIGSLDINGTVRSAFSPDAEYTGVDVSEGPGVDIVCRGDEFDPGDDIRYDVVISCETLEHDPHWGATVDNMVYLLKPGGFFLLTCATTGRAEHGTPTTEGGNMSPTPGYYENRTPNDILSLEGFCASFRRFGWEVNDAHHDLYMWGLKRH